MQATVDSLILLLRAELYVFENRLPFKWGRERASVGNLKKTVALHLYGFLWLITTDVSEIEGR